MKVEPVLAKLNELRKDTQGEGGLEEKAIYHAFCFISYEVGPFTGFVEAGDLPSEKKGISPGEGAEKLIEALEELHYFPGSFLPERLPPFIKLLHRPNKFLRQGIVYPPQKDNTIHDSAFQYCLSAIDQEVPTAPRHQVHRVAMVPKRREKPV